MKKIYVLFLSFFLTQPLWAELITQNIVSGCDDNYEFMAHFSLNQYTCAAGYFLPADSLGCVACPAGQSCPGGTYDYNAEINNGVYFAETINNNLSSSCAANIPTKFIARFTVNSYTCASGYYLPADGIECVICPANNKCSGGIYNYNETNDQGIVACPENYYAPTGSAACYPHILHVGNDNVYLKSTKTTVPALNIGIGNDVFYANMTTTQTPMNRDTTRQLKIEYDNNLYYICDDTVCGE